MAQSIQNPELKTYHGNCHCGAFKFSVKLPELTDVSICNCSFCSKAGYRWIFPHEFVVTKGDGALKEYKFGSKSMSYQFCPTCGTEILGEKEGSPLGINANALQYPAAKLFDLKVDTFDGKAIDPQHVPAKFAGKEPSADIENAKMYYGSCHCGDVTVAMKIEGDLADNKPADRGIVECDCSICTKHGVIGTYPLKTALSVHASSPSALTTYTFGYKLNEHRFCSNCGLSVYIHKREHIPEDLWKKYNQDETQEEWRLQQPVNLRIFEGVDLESLKEKGLIERCEWSKMEPQYVVPE